MPNNIVDLMSLREAITRKGARWNAGETWVSRLAPEVRIGLLSRTPFGPIVRARPLAAPLPPLPTSFDWTNVDGTNYVTAIKQQIGGTCTTFASAAALESCVLRMGFVRGVDIDLSEHTILSSPDGGDGNLHAVAAFMKATGLPPEDWFPGDLASARAGWQFETYRVDKWDCFYPTVVNEVKALILQNGPIVTTMQCPDDFFNYTGGIYSNVDQPSLGFHAVLVVGYDDHDQCFKAKNSWGKDWGEDRWGRRKPGPDNGYFRIAYSEFKSAIVNFGWDIHTYPIAVSPHSFPVVYEHNGYAGRSQALDVGRYDLSQLSIGNDVISSVKVPSGWKVTLYQHAGFQGATKVLTADANALPGLNDTTSSIIVEALPVVYEHNGYAGRSQALDVGRYDLSQLSIGNDVISSVKVPSGWKVTLYQHAGFQGATKVLTADANALPGFNDTTSSIIVEALPVVYEHNGYAGRSQALDVGRYDLSQLSIGNDVISSVKVPSGWKVTLYQHAGFQGATKVLTADANALPGFNDTTSSIHVERT